MKKTLLTIICSSILFTMVQAQLSFTVKPGLNLNGGNIGYKFGKVNPYMGMQFVSTFTSFESDRPWGNTDQKTQIHVFLPFLGCKVFLLEKEDIKGYANVTLFKPLVMGKVEIDGDEDELIGDAFNNASVWGNELGVGAEYYFSDHFSLGGEMGLRLGFYSNKWEDDFDNSEFKQAVSFNMSYMSCSLNFYF